MRHVIPSYQNHPVSSRRRNCDHKFKVQTPLVVKVLRKTASVLSYSESDLPVIFSFLLATFTNTMERVEAKNVTVSQGVRMLFSLITPNESSFATLEEVPKYVNQVSVTSQFHCPQYGENNYYMQTTKTVHEYYG